MINIKVTIVRQTIKLNPLQTLFISDDFYDQPKLWLGQGENLLQSMSKKDNATIKQKQWTLQQRKIHDQNGRVGFPKRDLFKTLTDAHSATAHHGRDKTEHYIRECYSPINQEVTEDRFPYACGN